MSAERLWAPWRSVYLQAPPGGGPCLFCASVAAPEAERRERLVLATAPAGVLMLNRYPYNAGHVMVAPRAHLADPSELADNDGAALAALLARAVRAVRAAYRPDGVNLGMNLGSAAGAGIAEHCHWHVVPRWVGDTNFMPVVGETRVLSESLDATWQRLSAQLAP